MMGLLFQSELAILQKFIELEQECKNPARARRNIEIRKIEEEAREPAKKEASSITDKFSQVVKDLDINFNAKKINTQRRGVEGSRVFKTYALQDGSILTYNILRQRLNSRVWTSMDGRTTKLSDMDDSHLTNTISYMVSNYYENDIDNMEWNGAFGFGHEWIPILNKEYYARKEKRIMPDIFSHPKYSENRVKLWKFLIKILSPTT